MQYLQLPWVRESRMMCFHIHTKWLFQKSVIIPSGEKLPSCALNTIMNPLQSSVFCAEVPSTPLPTVASRWLLPCSRALWGRPAQGTMLGRDLRIMPIHTGPPGTRSQRSVQSNTLGRPGDLLRMPHQGQPCLPKAQLHFQMQSSPLRVSTPEPPLAICPNHFNSRCQPACRAPLPGAAGVTADAQPAYQIPWITCPFSGSCAHCAPAPTAS